jgi:hypothetical protein
MRWLTTIILLLLWLAVPVSSWSQAPDVQKFLMDGRLADCSVALVKHLDANPTDDRARFGLGITQFLQAYEHVGQSLYRYGLRTERSFVRPAPEIRELWPQNPKPEMIDHAAARKIVQTFVDDMNRAEATLAVVKDERVKLPIQMASIKIDLFGLERPLNAGFLFQQFGGVNMPADQLENFVIAFDRGDVVWLRGYCHFLAAVGEVLLAVDSQSLFECTAHLLFEDVETPNTFLIEDREPFDTVQSFSWNSRVVSDLIATIHLLLRFPVKEPDRLKVAHKHLLAMCQMSREMWVNFSAETDDDNEWIPNSKQTGVLGVPVTADMIKTWLATVAEAELVLEGKRLVPFWRGTQADRGINLKRVFYESTDIDIPLWLQGTAATPYLEKGPLTKFIEPEMIGRIDRQFGGMNFIGFGFWFN